MSIRSFVDHNTFASKKLEKSKADIFSLFLKTDRREICLKATFGEFWYLFNTFDFVFTGIFSQITSMLIMLTLDSPSKMLAALSTHFQTKRYNNKRNKDTIK